MKYSKYLALLAAVTALTACSTDSDGDQELSYTYTFETSGEDFDANGRWKNTTNLDAQNLSMSPGLNISHKVTQNADGQLEWDGFVPAAGTETGDFAGDWANHLWSSASGNGVGGSADFLLAKWNYMESVTSMPETPSLALGNAASGRVTAFFINNTNYVYHVVSAPEFALTDADYLRVIMHAVDNAGRPLSVTQTIDLVKDGKVTKDWTSVTCSIPMGGGCYFQMEASRPFGTGVGQFPPYFCIDNYAVFYKY
ncbi:MAG: DUF4465 domain-containing protein [Bacteroidales bacterium]|nr:DUF4465 domain-containing protein [Bacteroidales bacterium]